MMTVRADFHIHSCLSPCGDLSMSPKEIARKAMEEGLHIIALTDHNSALNCPAFQEACQEVGIFALYGLEITTIEELHCLALFESSEQALAMGEIVSFRYKGPLNNPEKFGDQVYLDNNENILGEVEENLTQGATTISLGELGKIIHHHEGLFIPAHITRPSYSISSQLGFIPTENYDALEIGKSSKVLDTGNYPLLSSSDAHFLTEIGRKYTLITLNELSFEEIVNAIRRKDLQINLT